MVPDLPAPQSFDNTPAITTINKSVIIYIY